MKALNKKCRLAIIIALTAYIVKNIFVGADNDEGYGIVLGYRLVMGDRMLLEMWEPHQTSAIFTALFIAPFLRLTGGVAFLDLYLRIVYFLIHGAIAILVYHTLRTCVFYGKKQEALWLALVFFVSSPKCIYIPEYSNLHIWFFTLLCFSVLWYVHTGFNLKNGYWLLPTAAGIFLTCDVLAYPSMVILFPVFFALLWRKSVKKIACLFFALPCMAGGVLFCGYLLSYMTVGQILQVIPYIMGDGSHQTDSWGKVMDWLFSFGEMALVLLVTGLVAGILTVVYCYFKNKKQAIAAYFLVFFFILQTVYQFYCWFTSEFNATYPHLLYCFLLLSGIYCYFRSDNRQKSGLYLILVSFIAYFGVMLLSNWEPIHLMPYLILGVLGGLMYWSDYLTGLMTSWKGKVLPILCSVMIFSNVFGYCWLYVDGGWNHNSILTVRGINREGLRKGILTSYMSAYQYNTDQATWKEAVPAGSICLFVGPRQFYYMFGDCTIAAASTISTPIYDHKLMDYWEINPDRYPDIVVVESWFGDMRGAVEDSFIRQWLENEFCASQVEDYSYFTVYRK